MTLAKCDRDGIIHKQGLSLVFVLHVTECVFVTYPEGEPHLSYLITANPNLLLSPCFCLPLGMHCILSIIQLMYKWKQNYYINIIYNYKIYWYINTSITMW